MLMKQQNKSRKLPSRAFHSTGGNIACSRLNEAVLFQIDDNELSLPFSSALETKSTKQGPYRVIFLTLSRVTTISKMDSEPDGRHAM
ncbi:hypothetical protein HPP92_006048 [Vanilla planifolia]|uniref:Uncharacterized protein n=1 Tax=Vanilla planifolia TaxID=51239 RepID=A0A835RHZ4_VANPL|nr:hypothetical protein HPP92_006048 [Vanilla planifolia]